MTSTADLSSGPVLLAISITTELFALSTCLARFLICRKSNSRSARKRRIYLDDLAVAVAAAVSFVDTIFTIIEGSSMSIAADGGRRALQFDWLSQPWYIMGTTFAKISVCLFFIQLVGTVKKWRILLVIQILLMAILNFAFSLTTNLQCRPLAKLWDPAVEGECWDLSVQRNISYLQGAFSVFWWLFLSLFPVMIVRDLEMHQHMRWPFYFLSSLSLLAAIFAAVRTYETSRTVTDVFTFGTFFATVLSILEQNIGIVAANILPVGSLFCSPRQSVVRRKMQLQTNPVDGTATVAQASDMPLKPGTRLIDDLNGAGVNTITDNDSDSDLIIEGPRKANHDSCPSTVDKAAQTSAIQSQSQVLPQPQKRYSLSVDNKPLEETSNTSLRTIRDAMAVFNRGVRAIPAGISSLPSLPTLIGLTSVASIRGLQENKRKRSHPGGLLESQELFWPRGIIKTVEVEVVEEDIATVPNQTIRRQHQILSASSTLNNNRVLCIPGMVADIRLSRHSRIGSESDWTSLLRAGPTPPISRGPSRQGYH